MTKLNKEELEWMMRACERAIELTSMLGSGKCNSSCLLDIKKAKALLCKLEELYKDYINDEFICAAQREHCQKMQDDCIKDFLEGDRAHMQWISIKNALPPKGDCLAYGTPTCGSSGCGNKPIVVQARFDYDYDKGFEFGEYSCGLDATHWMPLPEAPNDSR